MSLSARALELLPRGYAYPDTNLLTVPQNVWGNMPPEQFVALYVELRRIRYDRMSQHMVDLYAQYHHPVRYVLTETGKAVVVVAAVIGGGVCIAFGMPALNALIHGRDWHQTGSPAFDITAMVVTTLIFAAGYVYVFVICYCTCSWLRRGHRAVVAPAPAPAPPV